MIPSGLFKEIPIAVTPTVATQQIIQTNGTFSSGDRGNAWLTFTSNADVVGLSGELVLTNLKDNTLVQKVLPQEGGTFTSNTFYYAMEEEILHAGEWYGYLKIVNANGRLLSTRFKFRVVADILALNPNSLLPSITSTT